MREVVLHRPDDVTPFLRYRVSSIPLIDVLKLTLYLPLTFVRFLNQCQGLCSTPCSPPSFIQQHLSTNHTRFLDLLVKPTSTFKIVAGQGLRGRPTKPRLTLSMVFTSKEGDDDLNVLSSWVPTVLRLLQPGRLVEIYPDGTVAVGE